MHGRFSRFAVLVAPVLAATLVAACDTGSPTGPRFVSLTRVSGNEQAAPLGAVVADPLVVRATDQNGVTVPGVALSWAVVSGGGTFIAASTSTDATGLGQAVFRLGNSLGPQQVSVSVGTQDPIVFTLTATSAPASQLRVSSGNNQVGTAGATLPAPIVALATDAANNPKSGVPVTFTVASGGGSVSQATVVTDQNGQAGVDWTLGVSTGAQTVVASAPGLQAVIFTATSGASASSSITLVSGNNQVASPGVTLPQPLRVQVTDAFGNGVPNVAVSFNPGPGAGSVTPAVALTDATGFAQATWTLGPAGGLKTMTASIGSASVQFAAGSTVTYAAVSAGGRHACAVSTDHVLYCWGYNGEGQLAIGQSAQGSGSVYAFPTPSAATGSLTFQQTVNSLYHGCAITMAGAGWCWGVNHDGRIGNNTSTSVETAPVQTGEPDTPSFGHSYRAMAVSRNHTCGLTLADRIYCWGYARDGQVGIGPTADVVRAPVEVAGDMRYRQMSAGALHTCAVTLSDDVFCWGVNLRGELGDASTTDRFVPTAVVGGAGFQMVAAGGEHTCGLTVVGVAWCWGSNVHGQLGDGTNTNSNVPVAVSGGLLFTSITAGLHHTCAITPAGAAHCWGRNAQGQLGTGGGTVNVPTPVDDAGQGLVFAAISAGDLATCAVTNTSRAYCWGNNQFGQLGDGTTVNRPRPTKVAFQP